MSTLTDLLADLPTINTGQTSDLVLEFDPNNDDSHTHLVMRVRVWRVRTGLADGEPYEHPVVIELPVGDGRWYVAETVDGDREVPDINVEPFAWAVWRYLNDKEPTP